PIDPGLHDAPLRVRVTVDDGSGGVSSSEADVRVQFVNRPPQPDLAADVEVALEGGEVHLDASTSSDADGQALAYRWEQVDTGNGMPPAGIADNGDGTATITLPDIAAALNNEVLRLRVVVDDQYGAANSEAFADIDVHVLNDNHPPQVNAVTVSRDGVNEGVLNP